MQDKKILVVGSGGREHAIAKKFKESASVSEVFCAPGNIGMLEDGIKLVEIDELDFSSLKKFVKENEISWTFVGPEIPLVAGIVDSFTEDGLKIFGPNKQAAQLEGSKDYAMKFMEKYSVPTAKFETCYDKESAFLKLDKFKVPVVIKEDGLAGGKGVVISLDKEDAKRQIETMFKNGQEKIVLEEFLNGDEYSMFVVVGDNDYQILPMAQDHKRAYDNDEGLNTGGMGAYSPLPQLSNEDYQKMLSDVVKPTIAGLKKAGFDYRGILYIGMILTQNGPKVIEYNVRLGDPETQVVLPRVTNDLVDVIEAALLGKKMPEIKQDSKACLGVVIAAKGYPKKPIKNQELPHFKRAFDISIDFANVKGNGEKLLGNGGRILTVISKKDNLKQAQQAVYDYLKELNFVDCFYRKDIGFKATGKKY